ncbi:methyltransferase family protein [Kushneria sinocarnis]|uniref:Methyltransferase family protein n=1 Tax=Kushneria sinocarnis TaxID=595502 RepID=A0A420WU13_9GAMM|nr:class I SAM-dependent methyltransferase [Kushneria sinocarnis]RKQ96933.1 methyltransferase family protein [Kushneria sinocarnis]
MIIGRSPRWHALIGTILLAGGLLSQAHGEPRLPEEDGQGAGEMIQPVELDVPFVPTPEVVVERMMALGEVEAADYVIDLGSGDGRIAVAAAEHGADRVLGVDIDPDRIREGRMRAERVGVAEQVEFRRQDLFETPIAEADVLTLYLLPSVNRDLRPKILHDMQPGSRVVSHAFDMDDWQPDVHDTTTGRDIYLWIVPADVAGRWQLTHQGRDIALEFSQRFQRLQGGARIDGRQVTLTEAELRGDRIAFTLDDGGTPMRFHGRVEGDRMRAAEPVPAMTGASPVQPAQAWQASRDNT